MKTHKVRKQISWQSFWYWSADYFFNYTAQIWQLILAWIHVKLLQKQFSAQNWWQLLHIVNHPVWSILLQRTSTLLNSCKVHKYVYSEKATNFCEISTLNLSYVVTVKSSVEISQNFVACSEYMNFKPYQNYWSPFLLFRC